MSASRWALLVGALLVAALLAVAIGTINVPLSAVFDALAGRTDTMPAMVVRTLRLPRVALAMLVGAGLGMSGAALQGTMRNPLAEPYLLGVSGGAAVGAVIATTLGLGATILPLAAFVGAILAVVAAFFVAHAAGARGDPRVLLMAGVVVGAFANAAIMVLLANAEANTVRNALWWMMGSVADATWRPVIALLVYVVVGGGALVLLGRQIDILGLGEDAAAGLGLDVDRAIRNVFVLASLIAAATVAAAGLVGFVGLVVPHLVRSAGVRKHRPLLIGSALAGATLVVLADLLGRVLRPPAELPLGAVTALIGVPFFLVKLRRLDVIRFSDVAVRYPRASVDALAGVSLEAKRGAITAVVGPNGSGKSTLVRALIGRVGVARGEVFVDATSLGAIDRAGLARRVAVVTQREELAFPVAVADYVALGRFPHLGIWHAAGAADRRAVTESMVSAGVDALAGPAHRHAVGR